MDDPNRINEKNQSETEQGRAPIADIPDLKRKERRGGAALLPGGAPGGGGAAVGGRLSLFGRLRALFGGGTGAGAAGTAPGGLAGLAALLGGKLAVAGAALALGAAGLVGYGVLKGGGSPRGPAAGPTSAANLAPISSSIRVYRGDEGSDSLTFARKANKGDILFPDEEAARRAAEAQRQGQQDARGAQDAAGAGAQGAAGQEGQDGAGKSPGKGLLGQGLGSQFGKMSSSLGGSQTAAFGKHDIFQGKNTFQGRSPGLGDKLGFGRAGKGDALAMARGLGKLGQGGGSRKVPLSSGGLRVRGDRSSKALAQLRTMGHQNTEIRGTGPTATEANSQAATNQWEGSKLIGTANPDGPGGPGNGPGVVPATPPGYTPTTPGGDKSTVENCGDSQYYDWKSGACTANPNFQGANVTPWQEMVDTSWRMVKIASIMLMTVGALILIGKAFCATVCSSGIGFAILSIAAAIALIISAVLGAVAMFMGNQIADMGDKTQGNILMMSGGIIIAASIAVWFLPFIGAGIVAAVVGAAGSITGSNKGFSSIKGSEGDGK